MCETYVFLTSKNLLMGLTGCSKRLIKQVQCRLKLLKNKRLTIVRQLREDLASLIKVGNEETAFNRVNFKLSEK